MIHIKYKAVNNIQAASTAAYTCYFITGINDIRVIYINNAYVQLYMRNYILLYAQLQSQEIGKPDLVSYKFAVTANYL